MGLLAFQGGRQISVDFKFTVFNFNRFVGASVLSVVFGQKVIQEIADSIFADAVQ